MAIHRAVVEAKLLLGEKVDPPPTGDLPRTPEEIRAFIAAPNHAASDFFRQQLALADRVGAHPLVTDIADRVAKRFRERGIPIGARHIVVGEAEARVRGLDHLTGEDSPFPVGDGFQLAHGTLADREIPWVCWEYIGATVEEVAYGVGATVARWLPHPGAFYVASFDGDSLSTEEHAKYIKRFARRVQRSPEGEVEALWLHYSGGRP